MCEYFVLRINNDVSWSRNRGIYMLHLARCQQKSRERTTRCAKGKSYFDPDNVHVLIPRCRYWSHGLDG
jgi:hypothetical protein